MHSRAQRYPPAPTTHLSWAPLPQRHQREDTEVAPPRPTSQEVVALEPAETPLPVQAARGRRQPAALRNNFQGVRPNAKGPDHCHALPACNKKLFALVTEGRNQACWEQEPWARLSPLTPATVMSQDSKESQRVRGRANSHPDRRALQRLNTRGNSQEAPLCQDRASPTRPPSPCEKSPNLSGQLHNFQHDGSHGHRC